MKLHPLLALPLALTFATASAQLCPPADIVYINGNILTGAGLVAGYLPEGVRQPHSDHVWTGAGSVPAIVHAMGIRDGKIWWVADQGTGLLSSCSSKETVDLHGAFVMPGFNDAHTHIASAGQQRLTVDLDGTTSLDDMLSRVRAYVAKAAPGQWILGGGWDHTKWASKTLPTRQDLDAVTAGHPAYLGRTDGHIALANTAALDAAGITAKTADPQGGKFDHDTQGQLTGIIREDPARSLLEAHIPPPSLAMRREALILALQDASSHGVTSLQDFSDWDDFLVLENLEHENQLHGRVSEWLTFTDSIETLKAHRDHHDIKDPMLHTGMLKGFMDGSLGSRTAALEKPYTDEPTNSGIARFDQKTLNKLTTERAEAGFQLGFHAIGDRANNMALTAFDVAKTERMKLLQSILPQLTANVHSSITVTDSSRYRIEHAQVLLPADFDRFAKLHIIASMQPAHLLTDMNWAADRLGPSRVKYAYAWRSFLTHGVPLAFGTDYPVESINPFRGLYSAITRQNEAGTATFQPQEKLTLSEALYAYTQGSAYAENAEKQKGILAPGFLADFVILDRDITKATPQELLHTQVLRTVVGGQTVYAAPSQASSELQSNHKTVISTGGGALAAAAERPAVSLQQHHFN